MPAISKTFYFFRNHVPDFNPHNTKHVILGTFFECKEQQCFKRKKRILDLLEYIDQETIDLNLKNEKDIDVIMQQARRFNEP